MTNNSLHTTRNIRKPGIVDDLNFCTFTQNCNGLINWSFEIPAFAYCQPLAASKTNRYNRWIQMIYQENLTKGF